MPPIPPARPFDALAERTVATLKGLAMDAVQAARSGHPGMPMGMADAAYVLWSRYLRVDPGCPEWPDRDRFVLSAGHGSMLLYGLLHLAGFPLSLDELRRFRQWGSLTPGHPEVGLTPGVETTTGPLGQGFANGVGMALAERRLRERFGPELCDHRVFGIVSDGDLMEGVAAEAASLAGHLGLGRLVYLYDDNRITIDGTTDLAFTEDVPARMAALGWHVRRCNGHDHAAVASAIEEAIAEADRPSLIACRTHIAHGAPHLQDAPASHGAPLGEEEVRATKRRLGLDPGRAFVVPPDVAEHMRACMARGRRAREAWEERLAASPQAEAWRAWHAPVDVDAIDWPTFEAGARLATRKASQAALDAIAAAVPQLLGGSADLAGSNGARIRGEGAATRDGFAGRNVHWGVREHAMAAACNGLALHGGILPFCATFLVFHDYMRPAVRLAALMGRQVVFVYSHDSVQVGEDGPTHQPVEHLLALRSIPGLVTIRPADAAETVEAWKVALGRREGPTALVLTRQAVPVLDRSVLAPAEGLARGGYVLADAPGGEPPQVVLIGTGSEVALALEARDLLAGQGVAARVVSLPSWELFDAQEAGWRAAVLPPGVPRVAVEAGRTLGWERYVGERGTVVGIDRFGASAPGAEVARRLGLTAGRVAEAAHALLD